MVESFTAESERYGHESCTRRTLWRPKSKCCTGDESEDGQNSVSHNDQDSDVSFESDNDEEIDAAEIEEEDWVDYIRKSTNEATENMGNEKNRGWKKTHKK